jgi:hypothetical protein
MASILLHEILGFNLRPQKSVPLVVCRVSQGPQPPRHLEELGNLPRLEKLLDLGDELLGLAFRQWSLPSGSEFTT